MKIGPLVFTVSASGTDPADGAAVGGIVAGEVRVVSRFDADLVLYPNPADGDEANLALKLEADASEVRADAYDASMRRVYSGSWLAVPASQPIVTMTGLKKWAPGVYLVRVRSLDAEGRSRKFKVVKMEIRR